MVRNNGFRVVAHAGEEGPAENVKNALDLLGASRIDHGIRSVDDKKLMKELARKQIPLTICPLSNLKLQVVNKIVDLPIKIFVEKGMRITINSDDPAYFGGYLNTNFKAVINAYNLNKNEVIALVKNSFKSSFLSDKEKEMWLNKIDRISN